MPTHLYHFSQKTLNEICLNIDLKVERVFYQPILNDYPLSIGVYLKSKGLVKLSSFVNKIGDNIIFSGNIASGSISAFNLASGVGGSSLVLTSGSITSGLIPALAIAPLIAAAPSIGAGTVDKDPPKLPIGVRTAETIYISLFILL